MSFTLDLTTIGLGIFVFLARVFDVTLGTLRTISIVQGRTRAAFSLGLFESVMWIAVVTTVIAEVTSRPMLGIFYALGFSTGNVVGILVEQRLALGHLAIRIISTRRSEEMAKRIRDLGFGVTTFRGDGMNGPVTLVYAVCGRKDYRRVVSVVRELEPDAFFTTEQAGTVSKLLRPTMTPSTGWRALTKRK